MPNPLSLFRRSKTSPIIPSSHAREGDTITRAKIRSCPREPYRAFSGSAGISGAFATGAFVEKYFASTGR
jgi:hypothetical protein